METELIETPQKTRTLVNKVQSFIKERGLSAALFKAHVIAAGKSFDTADRLLNGVTNINIHTLGIIANYFGCEISDLVDLD